MIFNDYQARIARISRADSVRILFVRMDEERSLQTKGGYTRRTARSHLDAAARIKTRDNIRRTTRDLRTRVAKCLRLMVEFSNIYCELYEICRLRVTNLTFKHLIDILILIYFVTCSLVATRWQQYSTHLHTNNTQNNTMKQNTQNRTHATMRIHKHNNKNTQFTKFNISIQNIQPYIQ